MSIMGSETNWQLLSHYQMTVVLVTVLPECETLCQRRSFTPASLLLDTARKHISCCALLCYKVIHYVKIDTITPHVCHGSLITLK